MKKSGKKTLLKIFLFAFVLFLGIGSYLGYFAFLKKNIYLDGKKSKIICIPSSSSYSELLKILEEENIFKNKESFEWLAGRMNLEKEFKPGRYRILSGMTNRELINLLKYGKQEKVKIIFNSADRTLSDIINELSEKLEISESELEEFFEDERRLDENYGFNEESIRCLFIPGTYELEWTTHLDDFMKLMKKEYESIWNQSRIQKAKNMGYTPVEICTLASIVQCESGIESEQKKIAGVYLNRLKKDMPLQADPTLIFARGDFSIQRVRNGDKELNSPYNTYKNKGLPPGPICLPYLKTIDAVLNHAKHNYLYFCAKPQLNGYSDYSETYEQHMKYANAYHKAMDQKGINR